jgi:hypothetical protein
VAGGILIINGFADGQLAAQSVQIPEVGSLGAGARRRGQPDLDAGAKQGEGVDRNILQLPGEQRLEAQLPVELGMA